MNRPEGISESAWEKARDVEFDFDCDWTADGRRSGEMQRREATVLIARAIQSSVEAEREALLNEVSTISGLLRHDDTPKTALSYVRAAIRKGS